jgi:hypothetical protein
MVYVQYFDIDLAGKLSPAMGDRAVVILDGRNNLENMIIDAVKFNGFRRPVYKAFQIFKGDSFSRSSAITEITEFK